MKKISLCIPSYNRPETLLQLIHSYQKQDYPNKELIISDDTQNDSIRLLVQKINDKSIKYFHNDPNLGFSRNLLKSMEHATGDYLLLLGDDDILFTSTVLSDYVDVFTKNPTVGFVYSNQIQFSDKLDIEYIITFLKHNKVYKKGKDAMEHMWIRSIFIGGIGVRNVKNLSSLYPSKKILHPQVEFIGNIINEYDSYLLANHHIGFRSHDDQIIFRALRNKKIRQEGNHMTVELYDIFNYLNKKYTLGMNFDFAAKQLIGQQVIMMFKEKSNLGLKEMKKNYDKFCELSQVARDSSTLKVAYVLSFLLPGFSIVIIRGIAIKLLSFRSKELFREYKRQLLSIISN